MYIPAQSQKKGIAVIHGGYDSFFEEFYPLVKLIAEAGYEVYMFEGPGQGGALHKYGLTMTHLWEKPVKAVLDYMIEWID